MFDFLRRRTRTIIYKYLVNHSRKQVAYICECCWDGKSENEIIEQVVYEGSWSFEDEITIELFNRTTEKFLNKKYDSYPDAE